MTARILVVDDNPLNTKLLEVKLARDYYVVSTAVNGLLALAAIAQEKPDLVLLDVMMPELDGFETCRRIKANPETSHIPVVIITAMHDVADRVKGLEAGADDFLTKPINDVALMARVRSLLRLKLIMDEWRLREVTSNQFLAAAGDEALTTSHSGGSILVLEDNGAERDIILKTLSAISARITFASTVAEAAAAAGTEEFDLVFASLSLKNEDGLALCPMLRAREATRQLPILLLAPESEMAKVAKGLDLGANDYLTRPLDANEMLARTRTQLRQRRHYQRMRNNYKQNLTLALVDPLTGAFNRRYLDAHLPKLLSRCANVKKSLAILMIDIDHFKKVNDLHGHAAGDAVLKETVNRISQSLRPSDLVVRMGGEEFAVILPETNLPLTMAIAERLRLCIQDVPFTIHDGIFLPVTISLGAASIRPDYEPESNAVFERADAALYQAKKTGRNCVVAESVELKSHA